MNSSDLHPFLTHLCKELTIHVEAATQKKSHIEPSEFAEIVIHSAREVLESYTNGEYDAHAYKHHFEEYKALAVKSIDSYQMTNNAFEKITDNQAKLIENATASSELINFETIAEKFSDLQTHLRDEVSHANSVIESLMTQVRDLETKTSLDPLTKTYNRNALQEHLGAILGKAVENNSIFALMIDIDNFKLINDRLGHIAGDKVLMFVAKLLKKALREGDKVYRFGGEEFLIILNRTDLEGAELVSNRLLNLCRQNKPLYHNEQVEVTLSIGMTALKKDDNMDSIVHRADIALYRAKANGKDRLEMEF